MPDWGVLGAIGELTGGVAVIVTVVYLALQIRQNTRAIRGSTLHAVTERMQSELHWSHEIAPIFTKAIERPTTLDSAEAWSLSEWLTAAMVARRNEYVQFQRGLIDDEVWQSSQDVIGITFAIPWNRNWWETLGRYNFRPEFVALVDGLLEQEPPNIDFSGLLETLKTGGVSAATDER